jgi:hypothetical protein
LHRQLHVTGVECGLKGKKYVTLTWSGLFVNKCKVVNKNDEMRRMGGEEAVIQRE